ncbi:MAG TPA: AmmeMemoRadiSam system protein B [Steroidobacteraceae bacterium]|nr:AmmeMemoRadiSam system protein B [Steroidobacteraceae bacterium]
MSGLSPAVRPAAVAGLFYPGSAQQLGATVDALLAGVPARAVCPKALIVPHAGYQYSGPVAAQAFGSLGAAARSLRRIVLLGPSHREWFRGLALPAAEAFATPLGMVRIDGRSAEELRRLPGVVVSDAPHRLEHSLEVQLPFLQRMAPDARIVPVVTGDASPAEVAAVIEALWGSSDSLILVSSDLSHYHPYAVARGLDAATADAILAGDETLSGDQACGCVAVNGLTCAVRRRGLRGELLDLRNSGDTAGDRQRVVGYGAFGFYDA